jgi:DNA-binding transcriptional ArsR family regulator
MGRRPKPFTIAAIGVLLTNLSLVTEKSYCTGANGNALGHKPHCGANPGPAVLSERALNAEEIADILSVARSNVSTSLKELQGWGLVKLTHMMGDRRDRTD